MLSVLRRLGVSEGRLRVGLVEAHNKSDLARAAEGEPAAAAESARSTSGEGDPSAHHGGDSIGDTEIAERQAHSRGGQSGGRGRGGRGAGGLYLPPFAVGVSAVTGDGLDVLSGAIESTGMLRGRNGEGCWSKQEGAARALSRQRSLA